ncbi:MAG: aminoglycoside 6'-acetyltransferase [Chloroflexi bacterium RBG_16_56_8]|nr:MAG: aminoglycoside 6'-acetyltransferase [Chloroflexi bacterium RBG_16_56_8]
MQITDLRLEDEKTIRQVAEILLEAFAHIEWPQDFDAAVKQVHESFAPKRISRVALDEHGDAVGWVGGIEQYDGQAYEMHPLAIKPNHQRRGIGTALVRDLEEQVRQRGAITVYLGSDDEFGGTTLYGVDVYPNVLEHIAAIKNIGNHPYEFYEKCGYTIVGILPDANGFGKPDIYMAKRIVN